MINEVTLPEKKTLNGSLTAFTFSFPIVNESDIIVILKTLSDGAEKVLTITSEYTVTNSSGSFEDGGTVTTVLEQEGEISAYAYSSDYQLVLTRSTPLTQATDLIYGGKHRNTDYEAMADKLTRITQELSEDLSRAILLKKGTALSDEEVADPTSGKWLYCDGSGFVWAENISTGEATVTDFAKTLLDDANAGAALTTLGLTAFIKTLIDDANAYTARKTLKIPMSTVIADKTAAYTIQSSDDGSLIKVDATAGNIAITLPAVGDVWDGFAVGIKKVDSGSNYVESTPDGSEEIDGGSSHILRNENDVAWYVVDGTGWKVASTGNSNLTAHRMLVGQGHGSVNPMAAMTNGQLVLGQTGGDPLPKTMSGDATMDADGVLTMASDAIADSTEGEGVRLVGAPAKVVTDETDYTVVRDIIVQRTGTLTIKFDLATEHYDVDVYAQVYRLRGEDLTAVGTEQSNDTESAVTFSEEIAGWLPGDHCKLYAKSTSSVYDAEISQFGIYSTLFGETVVT